MGDHIRKIRLDTGLRQRDIGEQIGVDSTTVWNWERHKSSPRVHEIPRIIEFLGYNPLPEPVSVGQKLLTARKALGLTQKEMAKMLGNDSTTLGRLEHGGLQKPSSGTRRKIEWMVN